MIGGDSGRSTTRITSVDGRTSTISIPVDGPRKEVSVPGQSRGQPSTSFIADEPGARNLHEDGNPTHRVRIEHDRSTLFVHLSDEDGRGWTVMAVDRKTRQWAVAQGRTQRGTATTAYNELRA